MAVDDQDLKRVLELLEAGGTCDYQPVQGGVLVFDSEKKAYEGVDIETFIALTEKDLISQNKTLNQWHPVWRPSFQNPIYIYEISDTGKAYLGTPSQ